MRVRLYKYVLVCVLPRVYRSRRKWLPNVQPKRLESDALGHKVRLRVTTHALRTIRKKGGLDAYLLTTRDEHLASLRALELKHQVIQALQKTHAMSQKADDAPSSS